MTTASSIAELGISLLTADQIDRLPAGSIVQTETAYTPEVLYKVSNYWRGTTDTIIYSGSGFPIGKTHLVRFGPRS